MCFDSYNKLNIQYRVCALSETDIAPWKILLYNGKNDKHFTSIPERQLIGKWSTKGFWKSATRRNLFRKTRHSKVDVKIFLSPWTLQT